MIIAVFAACQTAVLDDGYQLGDGLSIAADGLQRISAAIETYCNTATDDVARRAALALIRQRYPLIPEDGICTLQVKQ